MKRIAWILIIEIMLTYGLAVGYSQAFAGQYEVERIAYARTLINLIRTQTTPVMHLGVIKGYVFNDAKGFYFMLGDQNVTVDEFEAWLNKFNENDINQVKMLIAFEREFTDWPMDDENIKRTKEEISEGLAKLLEESKGK